MNISEASSRQSEWAQFYQRNLSSQPTGGEAGTMFGRVSPATESTVVTTTMTSASSPAGAGGDRTQPINEGRVGKAARRRSRASRKAPTTVLNTDTTNFRAMVQQFTGVPSRPFQAGYPHMADGVGGSGPATLSFGLAGAGPHLHQPPAVFPFGIQQQHYPQFQQHHERPLFMLGGAGGGGAGSGSSDAYLRGLGGSSMQRDGMDAAEGLLLERISSAQLMPRPAPSTGSSTTDGFLL